MMHQESHDTIKDVCLRKNFLKHENDQASRSNYGKGKIETHSPPPQRWSQKILEHRKFHRTNKLQKLRGKMDWGGGGPKSRINQMRCVGLVQENQVLKEKKNQGNMNSGYLVLRNYFSSVITVPWLCFLKLFYLLKIQSIHTICYFLQNNLVGRLAKENR